MKYLLISFFIFIYGMVCAQPTKVVSDFRIKTRIGLSYAIAKKWEVAFGTQAYFEKNASELDEYFMEVEGKYKPFKHWQISSGYRYTWNYSIRHSIWEDAQRINLSLGYKTKINNLRLSYRLRYQNIDDDVFLYAEKENIATNVIRNRLRFKYKRKKKTIHPFTSLEHYWNTGKLGVDNKLKWDIGIDFSLKHYGTIRSYYQIMHELTSKKPYTFYIWYVGYHFSF